ncbi:hypothetical protein GCM10022631_38450 [Deinococcus rubellus]
MGTPVTAQGMAARLKAAAPLLLLLEDLHEAPETERQMLSELAALAPRLRGVVLLATSRAAEAAWPLGSFRPLDAAEAAALFQSQFGQVPPTGLLEWVQVRAAGNSLFLLEYWRALARSGSLYNDGQRWHWRTPPSERLPDSLEALILQALQAAGDDLALLSARAAEPTAGPSEWAALAGVSLGELEQGQRRLTRAGLLQDAGFAHPLYREVLLGRLTPETRTALARRALALPTGQQPRRVAEHLRYAAWPAAETLHALGVAAEAAERGGEMGLAGELLAQAARLADADERPGLALKAAQRLQNHALGAALELALLALADPAHLALAAPLAAQLSARLGGLVALQGVLDRMPESAATQRAVCEMQARHGMGDHRGVLELWSASPRLQVSRDPGVVLPVLLSLLAVGRAADVQTLLPTLETVPLTPDQQARLGSVRMLLHYQRGENAEAARAAGELERLLSASGQTLARAGVLHNRAVFLQRVGELEDAAESARQAADLRRALGDLRGAASSLGLQGELAFERGQLSEAEDAVSTALDTLELYGPSHFQLNMLSMLARLHAHAAEKLSPLLAVHFARRALEMADTLGNRRLWVETVPDAAQAHLSAGEAGEALRLADLALADEDGVSSDPRLRSQCRAVRGLAQAALGERAAALESLNEALALAEAHADETGARHIRLELARLSGDVAALRAHLVWFEEHGNGFGALKARRFLTPLEAPEVQRPSLTLTVLSGAPTVADRTVRGERRQALLLALLEARLLGQAEASSLSLLDLLYAGQPEQAAQTALKQVVSQLRRQHGAELIWTTAHGYALGAVQTDAEQFLAKGDSRLWRSALPAFEAEAVGVALRQRLRQALGQTLISPSADLLEAGRAAGLLLESDPYDQPTLKLALLVLQQVSDHRRMGRTYAGASARLSEVGEHLPERWQDFLGQGQQENKNT